MNDWRYTGCANDITRIIICRMKWSQRTRNKHIQTGVLKKYMCIPHLPEVSQEVWSPWTPFHQEYDLWCTENLHDMHKWHVLANYSLISPKLYMMHQHTGTYFIGSDLGDNKAVERQQSNSPGEPPEKSSPLFTLAELEERGKAEKEEHPPLLLLLLRSNVLLLLKNKATAIKTSGMLWLW